jgi:hypothetical protein
MNTYLHGTDVLGALPADFQPLPAQRAPVATARQEAALKGAVIGGAVGFLALGAGGAWLWKAHPVIGFLLGSMLGWPLGAGVGAVTGGGK